MIPLHSPKQQSLNFGLPFEGSLNPENRWVKLAAVIPWKALCAAYEATMDKKQGARAKPARMVLGALLIKHKLGLSDEETIEQVRENPYLQYFLGLERYSDQTVFVPSLFVEIRKRLTAETFAQLEEAIVTAGQERGLIKTADDDNDQPPDEAPSANDTASDTTRTDDSTTDPKPSHHGKLIMDATVAPQNIHYPTDVSLLNECRVCTEALIDQLHAQREAGQRKPRTYRRKARQAFLNFTRKRKANRQKRRHAIREQLQYIRRNFKHITALLDEFETQRQSPSFPLSANWQRKWFIAQTVYAQQEEMWRTRQCRCPDRIVSFHQPHVRPIVRGKAGVPVEFGSKLSVSLVGKLAFVDELRWDAFNEAGDLPAQVERYLQRFGFYPEVVLADGIYGTRSNRSFLKEKGIRFGGKPLGRPKKLQGEAAREQRQQRHADAVERIPIEGKFGQGKVAYGLGLVRARLASTSEAWVRAAFLIMNILALARCVFAFLCQKRSRLWAMRKLRALDRPLPGLLRRWSRLLFVSGLVPASPHQPVFLAVRGF